MVTLLALFGLFVIALETWSSGGNLDANTANSLVLLFGVLIILGLLSNILRWWFTCYAMTTSRSSSSSGIWNRLIIDIPNTAVQSVVFSENSLGRTFGFGSLQFSRR